MLFRPFILHRLRPFVTIGRVSFPVLFVNVQGENYLHLQNPYGILGSNVNYKRCTVFWYEIVSEKCHLILPFSFSRKGRMYGYKY